MKNSCNRRARGGKATPSQAPYDPNPSETAERSAEDQHRLYSLMRADDPRALDTMFEIARGHIFRRLLRHRLRPEDAEDVAQDASLRLCATLAKVEVNSFAHFMCLAS